MSAESNPRVAICISGQPRSGLKTFPHIYENIIRPNNADVFIHMHHDKTNLYIEKSHMDNGNCVAAANIDDQLIALYKPIRYLVEAPRAFSKPNLNVPEPRLRNFQKMNAHKGWTDVECKAHIIKQLTSMYYSIYKCNELKELYANESGFVYDYVIRIRFDFFPKQPILCRQFNPNSIYYAEIGQSDNLISDWFNMGSNAIMNVYASLYLNMEYLNTFQYYKKEQRLPNTFEPSDICGGMSEFMLRDLCYLYKIPKCALRIACELTR